MRFGGFPEPAVRQSEKFLRRWHVENLERLFQEDTGQTEQIRDLGSMKLLSDMLPERAVRSLRKEPKLYLWDWSEIRDEGRRFENMVASHLLKTVHLLVDGEGHRAKLSDASVSRSLLYFKRKLDIPPAYQVVAGPRIDVVKDGVCVVSAGRFLARLV